MKNSANVIQVEEEIAIRKATVTDSQTLSWFIINESTSSAVLGRKAEEIAELDYFIALSQNQIIGSVGYKLWCTDGAEIISLITKKDHREKGVAKKLLAKCLEEVKNKKQKQIFTLTTAPGLFQKFGFKKISKTELSEKAKSDCARCRNGCNGIFDPKCKEIALAISE